MHKFKVARPVHRRVAPALGLTDLGTLTTPESRNIVRKVRQPDGSTAVLKVIGNLREPGEAEALRAWSACGLPCVRPLYSGEVPLVPGAGPPAARYLLTEYIDRPVLAVPEAASLAERERITRRLTECVSVFHVASVMAPDRARTWVERVGAHLHWTLPLIRREQLAEPPGWQGKLEAACARGSRLLHGDASGANTLVLDDGSLVLLDPPGAIRGPREADVGHIVSHVACAGSRTAEEEVADIDPMLRAARETAPSLDPAAIALFAGVNLLTWAGYFLVGHVNRNAGSFGADGTPRGHSTKLRPTLRAQPDSSVVVMADKPIGRRVVRIRLGPAPTRSAAPRSAIQLGVGFEVRVIECIDGNDVGGAISALLQPFIHDQVICVAAPAVAIFGVDGQIRGTGAQGLYLADRRIISTFVVRLDGHEPEPISCVLTRPGAVRIVSVYRSGDEPTPDPVVTLEQVRDMRALTERLSLRNHGRCPVTLDLGIEIAADLAPMFVVKVGGQNPASPSSPVRAGIRFADPNGTVTITAQPWPDVESGHLRWRAEVDPGAVWTVELDVAFEGIAAPVVRAGSVPWRRPQLRSGDIRLNELVRQSLDDLEGLLIADPRDPLDTFLAAGSPWFLTLFGRDSLWAARMLLPLGTGLAGGTLRALARRQGRQVDEETDEEPGKIPHELRAPGSALPTLSYSTVDATPLFVTLLADAWRWGMPEDKVAALLPAAVRALEWTRGQTAGAAFLRYERRGPGGLSNQGWKDSADAIVHRDGSRAKPPIALSEVQAYAYEAAVRGADLLEAFGRPGADACRNWAGELRERFHAAFWAGDHPVLALDGNGRPVDSIASNMGHLLGTGILDDAEEAAIARRLSEPALASGWGLRTLSSASPAFNPLGYHTGSVWAHDTAIAAWGLFRSGRPDQAVELLRGVVDAAPHFGYRLPELYGGEAKVPGHAPLPYPAACRPQAWSAAAAIVLLTVLTGLEPDVPAGRLTVRGAHLAPFGPIDVRGLVIGPSDITVQIDADGRIHVVAPGLTVR